MLPNLQADRTLVADLDAQILDLERSLSAIRIQRTLVQERLDSYTYPVLTLPNEIVCEIFFHYLPTYPACPPLVGPLSPTNLAQVCQKWREVALATPLLWRAIMWNSVAESLSPQTLEIVSTWLSRSRCCPISFAIESGYWFLHIDKVLDILSPHHTRWEYLELQLSAFSLHRLFAFERPMPLLRHLDFRGPDSENCPDFIVCGEAPLLRSVILNHVAARKSVLPWAQLTSLQLRDVTPGECGAILIQGTNLVRCDVSLFTVEDDDDDMTWPNINLLRLESLILVARSEGRARDHLQGFLLPALSDLCTEEDSLGANPCDSLASFISRSGRTLQRIWIKGRRSISQDTYTSTFPAIRFAFDDMYTGQGLDAVDDANSSEIEDD